MVKDILFEIGLEELPARFIVDAETQLFDKTANWLDEARIAYETIQSFSTPRRLAVLIKDAAEKQTSLEEEVKGPSLKAAQDDNGEWTKAAIGFTRSQGKTVDDIYVKDFKGSPYVFIEKQITGQATFDILPQFRDILTSIQFPNTMRWGDYKLRYARPIRWLTALYGEDIIPFSITNVKTDNKSYGHRFLGSTVTLSSPADYEKVLESQYVIPRQAKRRQMIIDGLKQAEKDNDFYIQEDETLLTEVSNLIEYPTVFTGSFASSYLTLPPDVLMTSMKENQSYFPVKSKDGKLLPYFAAVRNGDSYALDKVIRGNERVLKARLSDAQFFYEEDQKQSIDDYLERLDRIVFQEKLGTIGDKVRRVVKITSHLTQDLNLDEVSRNNAIRTAEICKLDLPTQMVEEFTNLQGIIGETYALQAGEKQEVARAISEHYLPNHSGGQLPETVAGEIVSVADKLDTVIGCILIGLVPSGSEDPHGLRRQATGILRILKETGWHVTLESLLNLVQDQFMDEELDVTQTEWDQAVTAIHRFFQDRLAYLLKEQSLEPDIIQAVTSNGFGYISYVVSKANVLSHERHNPDFKSTQEALVRVLNLASKTNETNISESLFDTDSEKHLYEVYLAVKDSYSDADNKQNASEALSQLGKLTKPIHNFFMNNMVMDDDEIIRANRLALLNHIASLINDYADLSVIEWKQYS